MNVYLDSSIVVRVLFRQGKAIEEWGKWDTAFASEILSLEVRRAIDRLRIGGNLDDLGVADAHEELSRIENEVSFIPVTRTVLRRAALPMATVVRTLDAIHLASAILARERGPEPVVFATHDVQQGTAARALGFSCLGLPA